MKPLGSEISDFEKRLSSSLGLEQSIDNVFYGLNSCVVEKDKEAFRSIWDSWVKDMPQEDPGVLADVQFKYPRPDKREKVFATYRESFSICLLHAVAAQRAFDRKDSEAAWPLVEKAARYWEGVDRMHDYLLWEKYRAPKEAQAAVNGGIPGQRVRYRIAALLHQKQFEPGFTGFPDVTTAIHSIHAEMVSYVKKAGLKINLDELDGTVRGWLVEHPAFRYELEELFVNDEITDLKT